MSWRRQAAPIIAKVLKETDGKTEREIRNALRDAYPFGPRQHWPYKVWLDEIKRQRFGKPEYRRRSARELDDATQSLFADVSSQG